MQLRIMSSPDYRFRMVRAALQGGYEKPPPDYPDCDGIYDGAPLMMAADMDLRRIDAACEFQKSRGNKRPCLLALKAQAEAFYYERYRDTGKARVFEITDDALKAFFVREGFGLYTPPDAPFIPPEGGVLRVPPIRTHRKA
jgi:hypothetical protein